MSESDSIIKIIGEKPGKTVAVFGGIHGNELAGVMAIKNLQDKIKISAGTVYFVIANFKAVEKKERFLEKNLNRLFKKDTEQTCWEEQRAIELMKILDSCDGLLDLHGYNGPEDEPFIITDGPGLTVAETLDFKHVITGFNQAGDGGTDAYMFDQGKVGICCECGSNFRCQDYVGLAEDSIKRFLSYMGLTDEPVGKLQLKQQKYGLVKIVKRNQEDFEFIGQHSNFDELPLGEMYAREGDIEYRAEKGERILFPHPNQKIGHEAFTIVREY